MNSLDTLWDNILVNLEDSNSLIIVSSELIKNKIIHSYNKTININNILTISDLWNLLTKEIKKQTNYSLVPPLDEITYDYAVAQFLREDFFKSKHLKNELPDSIYKIPSNPQEMRMLTVNLREIQEGVIVPDEDSIINQIRNGLKSKTIFSQSDYREKIALLAKELNLNKHLIFLPLGIMNPQFGILFRSLSEKNKVSAYFISENKKDIFELLDIDDTNIKISNVYSQKKYNWLKYETQELDNIISYVDDLINKKKIDSKKIAIVHPNPEDILSKLEYALKQINIDLLFTKQIETNNSLLGNMLLILISISNWDDYNDWQNKFSNSLNLNLENQSKQIAYIILNSKDNNIDDINYNRNIELLNLYYDFAKEFLSVKIENNKEENKEEVNEYEFNNGIRFNEIDIIWFENFSNLKDLINSYKLEIDLVNVLKHIKTNKKLIGNINNITLCSLVEAVGYNWDYLIIAGLNENFPNTRSASAFVDENIYKQAPKSFLDQSRLQLISLLYSADGLSGYSSNKSSFIFPSQDLYNNIDIKNYEANQNILPKNQVSKQVKNNKLNDNYLKIIKQAQRLELDESFQYYNDYQREKFSVTELQDYFNCPYGWFVRHQLKVKSPPSQKLQIGNLAHLSLNGLLEIKNNFLAYKYELAPIKTGNNILELEYREYLINRSINLSERINKNPLTKKQWIEIYNLGINYIDFLFNILSRNNILDLNNYDVDNYKLISNLGIDNNLININPAQYNNLDEIDKELLRNNIIKIWTDNLISWPYYQHLLETRISGNFEGYQINGRIDRIDFNKDNLFIIDYKTSKNTLSLANKNMQAFLYSYLLNDYNLDAFAYYSIDNQQLLTINKKELSLKNIIEERILDSYFKNSKEEVLNVILNINNGQWYNIGGNCQDWCPHYYLSSVKLENLDLSHIEHSLDNYLTESSNNYSDKNSDINLNSTLNKEVNKFGKLQ